MYKKLDIKIKVSLIFLLMFLITAVLVQTKILLKFDLLFYGKICSIRTEVLNVFMLFITNFGDVIAVLALAAISFTASIIFKVKNYSLEILSISAFQHILNRIAKAVFQRERLKEMILVEESSYSFPSGHTMTAVVLWGFVIYLMLQYNYKKAAVIPLIIIFMVGFSRIYLGAHYFTDVLGGFFLGIAILNIAIIIFEKIRKN